MEANRGSKKRPALAQIDANCRAEVSKRRTEDAPKPGPRKRTWDDLAACDNYTPPPPKRRRVCVISIRRKLEIIRYFLLTRIHEPDVELGIQKKERCMAGLEWDGAWRPPTAHEVSDYFKVPVSTCKDIWKHRYRVVQEDRSQRRPAPRSGAERWAELEMDLMAQFLDWRQRGGKVNIFWLRRRAKQIFETLYGGERDSKGNRRVFRFSNGWFARFSRRWGISFRRLTKQAQKVPEEYRTLVNRFLQFIRRNSWNKTEARDFWKYRLSNILNMDETPLPFDFFDGYTYHLKGERTVAGSVENSSWVKRQATLVLYIFSDGVCRLKPKLIFHGVPGGVIQTAESSLYDPRVTVVFNESAYNNEKLFTQWIDEELLQEEVLGGRDSLLVMDHATFHKTPEVLKKLRDNNILPALIPGGCTGLLQPLDVSINKPFKKWIREALDEVLDADADVPNSSSSKISRRRIAITKAVGIAFDRLKQQSAMIQNSFIHTGIAIDPSGCDDSKIRIKDHPDPDFAGWEDLPEGPDLAEPQEPSLEALGFLDDNHEIVHELEYLEKRTEAYSRVSSVEKLKALCRDRGLKGYSKCRRREVLIRFLCEQDWAARMRRSGDSTPSSDRVESIAQAAQEVQRP